MNWTRTILGSLGAFALAASALGSASVPAQAQKKEHPRSYYPTLVRADLEVCRPQLLAYKTEGERVARSTAADYQPGGVSERDFGHVANLAQALAKADRIAAMDPIDYFASEHVYVGGGNFFDEVNTDPEMWRDALQDYANRLASDGSKMPRPDNPNWDWVRRGGHVATGDEANICVGTVWMQKLRAMHAPRPAVAKLPAQRVATAASPAMADSARAAGAAGNHTGAIQHYGEALERDPGNPTYLVERGIQYQLLGQRDAAIRDFAAAIAAHPDYASAYYYRAGAYQEAGETRLAFADAAKALQLAPGDAGVRARHQALRSALAAPPPAAPGHSAQQTLSLTQITDCTNEAIAAQRRSQSGPGDPQKRIGEMALYQKFLFTHQCAGHPDAAQYIANADAMIASTGIAEVPLPAAAAAAPKSPKIYDTPQEFAKAIERGEATLPTGMVIRDGIVVDASSETAEFTPYPIPDSTDCMQIVDQENIFEATSTQVSFRNHCSQKLRMQACYYSPPTGRYYCHSETGGEGTIVSVRAQLTEVPDRRVKYVYAGCSEKSVARANGGNCGGDPNTEQNLWFHR